MPRKPKAPHWSSKLSFPDLNGEPPHVPPAPPKHRPLEPSTGLDFSPRPVTKENPQPPPVLPEKK